MKPSLTKLAALSIICSTTALSACSKDDKKAASPTPQPTQTAPAKVEMAPVQTPASTPAKLLTPLQIGQGIFKKRCRSCHTADEGGKHKVGPNLWDIYGRTSGTMEGFKYSPAMKDAAIVWSDPTLSGYIENPKKYLPKNRMSFAGLRQGLDRAALLVYLESLTNE